MILGETIFNILHNDQAIRSLVNASVFPSVLPQGQGFPAIIYSEISRETNDTKTGVSTNDKVNVQFDIYTETYKAAHELAIALRSKLDRFTNNGIDLCVMEAQSDEGFIEEHRVYRIIQQYEFRLK